MVALAILDQGILAQVLEVALGEEIELLGAQFVRCGGALGIIGLDDRSRIILTVKDGKYVVVN